mmetsp:Transcript_31682/g.38816  ORF Transcript_31682/g.38816 Transcript_31682/m.38816 type:complete len:148 (+) Transcript_31682:93-536(+)
MLSSVEIYPELNNLSSTRKRCRLNSALPSDTPQLYSQIPSIIENDNDHDNNQYLNQCRKRLKIHVVTCDNFSALDTAGVNVVPPLSPPAFGLEERAKELTDGLDSWSLLDLKGWRRKCIHDESNRNDFVKLKRREARRMLLRGGGVS